MFMAIYSNAQGLADVALLTPPLWGPVGYTDARYYYIPDVESYYSIKTSMFIYLEGNNWISSNKLPPRFANYDIDHGYKVVLTGYRGNSPYTHFIEDRKQFPCGHCNMTQITYKDLKPRTDNGPVAKHDNENPQVINK